MAAPTLYLSPTTITLPYPDASSPNVRNYDEQRVGRRTLSGILRTSVLYASYSYTLGFSYVATATYDAIVTMWAAAVVAQTYPTFTWSGGPWPSATSGVSVAIEIGPMKPDGPVFGFVNFALTITEVVPL